ncbi:hypothetical protein [Clostridium pasteurianum]|uniref:Uncharacterized protein n=1 Tax=Clostridium pasteurianum BC1 TaxID=86416 RepID=R4K6X3_CLOPA|nr:hypothetical protein [Clostridium pasteurianum]AGK95390.1 hypothetical protein Clopa_0328 [Clostridium pasteurianum BC1]
MTNKEIAVITYKILQKRKHRKKRLESKVTMSQIDAMERSMGRKLGQI